MVKLVIQWSSAERLMERPAHVAEVLDLREHALERLAGYGVEIVPTCDLDSACEALVDADVFIGAGLPPRLLRAAKKLKWVQAASAGLDGFRSDELRCSNVVITSARGI